MTPTITERLLLSNQTAIMAMLITLVQRSDTDWLKDVSPIISMAEELLKATHEALTRD